MEIVDKLSSAIRFKTVSYTEQSRIEYDQYEKFLEFLPAAFPTLFSTAEKELISDYSLVLKLPGRDPSAQPVLLLAHYDVVPADESAWKFPPFEGRVAENALWGRGALDNKGSLITILQAAEEALEKGWQPERTVYFAAGHDEEIGGGNGAKQIVQYFRRQGVYFHAVYDEGMTIVTPEVFSMVDKNVAFIGTSEKGHVDIEISAVGKSGHASMPPSSTAAGTVARAVSLLEKNPFPARIIGPVAELFEYIAPHTRGFTKLVLQNSRLCAPVLKPLLQRSHTSNALIRTTQAATMLQGSPKENVLPARASAVVNCRILPGETIDDVVRHMQRAVDGLAVTIAPIAHLEGNNPLPVSSTQQPGYRWLAEAVKAVYPDIIVSPSIVLVTTDSRHFKDCSDNIYRFIPFVLDKALLGSIHSADERLPIEDLHAAVRVYSRLLEQF
ncbi:MAG: M20/M25/M40 family metallo-hydrolase [Spirochaetota bacterium]